MVHVLRRRDRSRARSPTAVTGGKWSATLSKALPSGKHTFTAFATEKSGLGNEEGKSSTVDFEVNTEPPIVTIVGAAVAVEQHDAVVLGHGERKHRSRRARVRRGDRSGESEHDGVAAGTWSTSTLSKALPTGKHSFTAFATEKSGLGQRRR